MKVRHLLTALLVFVVGIAGAQTTTYVTTVPPLNGGNGQSGVSFNVKAYQDIILTEFWISFTGTGTNNVTVWYNPDSIKGAPTINATNGWVQLASNVSVNVTSAGNGNIFKIPYNFNFPAQAGKTYGFFIQANSGSFRYTNGGTSVQSLFSNGVLQINTGNNVGYGGGAPSPGFHIREFNGKIGYILSKKGYNNAAVTTVTSPVYPFCSGNKQLKVLVKNNGFNRINNVKLYWSLNGVQQPVVNYNNIIDTVGSTAGNTATVTLGTVNFAGEPHDIEVYTSMPNSTTDTVNSDDTLVTSLGPSPYAAITAGGPTVFCTAGSINVTLYAPTGTGLDYQWYKDGQPIAGATDTLYNAKNAGDYTVKVDSNGCDNTSSIMRVDNLAMPLPLVHPSGYPVLCTGDSLTMTANAGITGASYQWQFQGKDIPGAVSASYTAVSPGNYTVITSKYVCNATSPGITLVPMAKPEPVIEEQPDGTLITGTSFASYQWRLDGNDIAAATNFAYKPAEPGSYTVYVSNGGCEAESDAKIVHSTAISNVGTGSADIRVYPNPVNALLHVQSPIAVNVFVTGIDGRVVIRQRIKKGVIDCSKLNEGVYLIRITDENGNTLQIDKITKVN